MHVQQPLESGSPIDDARGFANVLVRLFQMNAALPRIDNATGAYR